MGKIGRAIMDNSDKIMATIEIIDTITDPGIKIQDTPRTAALDIGKTTVLEAKADDLSTAEQIIADMGYVINVIGNDDDAVLKSPEEIKSEVDEEIENSIAIGNSPSIGTGGNGGGNDSDNSDGNDSGNSGGNDSDNSDGNDSGNSGGNDSDNSDENDSGNSGGNDSGNDSGNGDEVN